MNDYLQNSFAMVYHPAVDSSPHVYLLFSQFYFAYAANLKLFQQRHLTIEEYLAEQRAGKEAAEKDLFPVNVIDITLGHKVIKTSVIFCRFFIRFLQGVCHS